MKNSNTLLYGYRPDIDGLRALAVLLVVFYHFDPKLVTGGFIGVDIFFVISGYLITGIIAKGIEAGTFSLTDFYIRRCRRILPALFTMLFVIWCLGWVVLLPDEFKQLGKQMLAGLMFSENILLMNESGYFDVDAVGKPLLHLWSLAIEEQFYLFWPLLLLVIYRFRINVYVAALVLMGASFAFGIYYSEVNPVRAFYLLPSRFWEILAGACLFYTESRFPAFTQRKFLKNVQAFAALAIIFIFSFIFYSVLIFEKSIIYMTWSAVSCLAAVLLISAQGAWFNRRILSSPPLVFIGRISYPLYLWHWPLLSIAQIIEDEQPIIEIRLGAVLLSFLLAWLTFRFIEQPIRNRTVRFVGPGALAATAVIGALAYSAFSQTGFLGKSWGENTLQFNDMDKPNVQMIIDKLWWKEHQTIDKICIESPWNSLGMKASYCRLTSDTPRVAILGDSHANHLVPGLLSVNDPDFSHIVAINVGSRGFENVRVDRVLQLNEVGGDPYLANEYFFAKIRNDKNIRYVIISMYMAEGSPLRSDLEINTSPNQTEKLYTDLQKIIESFEKSGKQVIFFLDTPHMEFDPLRCLNVRRFSMTSRIRLQCAKPFADALEKQTNMRNMVSALAKKHPKMKVFDPFLAMCDESNCYAIKDKKLLYRDADHLSLDGSIFIANAFMASRNK